MASASERWVLLGLAPSRAPWFGQVSQWATSASIAADFVKCVSAEEVCARMASGRAHSALLVDAAAPGLDRDLLSAAARRRTAVIVVGDASRLPWARNSSTRVLPGAFSREDLLDTLAACASPLRSADELPPLLSEVQPAAFRGRLVVVCGPGGTGASLAAMALAQGLAGDSRYGGRVLLADMALHADQAVLHDAPDLGPGLQELVEAHRLGRPGLEEVRAKTFLVEQRRYHLLLGLRHPGAWAVLRPRAVDAAVEGLRQAFQVVVADVTGELESEAETGSAELEERNHLARSTLLSADAVVMVGQPGLKGVHSLARLIRGALDLGVESERVLVVFSRGPRAAPARAGLNRSLLSVISGCGAVAGIVHWPERRVEQALRDVTPLPVGLVGPLVVAVDRVMEKQADRVGVSRGPTRIEPGSLGHWSLEEGAQ